jgi:hypothetical protein
MFPSQVLAWSCCAGVVSDVEPGLRLLGSGGEPALRLLVEWQPPTGQVVAVTGATSGFGAQRPSSVPRLGAGSLWSQGCPAG